MKTRAAVACKAGAPLTVETVDQEGPRAGEALEEVKATGSWQAIEGADAVVFLHCMGTRTFANHIVAAAGQEIATRPFQLVTGRKWEGSAFGGACVRTDAPKIVDWCMEGKIQIDPLITPTLQLEDIKHGFELMERGGSIRSVVVH